MKKKNSAAEAKRGFLLIASLAVTVFLTLGSASLLVNGIGQTNTNLRLYGRASALQLAEAGLNQAALNLRTPTAADDVLSATLPSGAFAVTMQQSLGNNLYQVQSTGTTASQTRSLQAFYRTSFSSVFQFAAFADEAIELSGSMQTDSYDSRNGPYNDDPTSPDYNQSNNGDVGTNSILNGGIDISGTSLLIDGQLFVGPDVTDPTAAVTGYTTDVVTGGGTGQDVVAMGYTIPMTPVVVPNGVTCIDKTINANEDLPLSPTGGPLSDGTYCYNNLNIEGGGSVTPSGPVKVYLTGTLSVVGNTVVGNPNDPTNLIFYMTANSIATIEGTLAGSSQFYGGIYAPEATIAIGGNAEIFGAISANRIHIAGSALIHYDEAMASLDTDPGYYTTTLTAWQEL